MADDRKNWVEVPYGGSVRYSDSEPDPAAAGAIRRSVADPTTYLTVLSAVGSCASIVALLYSTPQLVVMPVILVTFLVLTGGLIWTAQLRHRDLTRSEKLADDLAEKRRRYDSLVTQVRLIPTPVRFAAEKMQAGQTLTPNEKAALAAMLFQESVDAVQRAFKALLPTRAITVGLMIPYAQDPNAVHPSHLKVSIRSRENFCPSNARDDIRLTHPVAGRVFAEKCSILVRDARACELPVRIEDFGEARSLISVPVVARDVTLFVLSAAVTDPNAVTEHHFDLMRAAAELCALIALLLDFEGTFGALHDEASTLKPTAP